MLWRSAFLPGTPAVRTEGQLQGRKDVKLEPALEHKAFSVTPQTHTHRDKAGERGAVGFDAKSHPRLLQQQLG